MARVLFLVCAFFVSVRGGTLAVKGYYCQDPDTGRLYGVNATWPSTSFCGNYTCKIRLRNQDNMVQASSRIVNVTSNEYRVQESNELENKRQNSAESNENGINDKPVYNKNKELDNYLNNIHSAMGHGVDDRFLNVEEIKTISELLPTVKKSDLEAIIEIYNLAQDIYKEMDSAPPNDEVIKTPNGMVAANNFRSKSNNDNKSNDIRTVNKNHISYWYEPLGFNGFRNNKPTDMKLEGSELRQTSFNPYEIRNAQARQTTVPQPPLPQFVNIKLPIPLNPQLKWPGKPKIPPQTHLPLYTYPQSVSQPNHQRETDATFFTGSLLSNRDFGRLAYYYPMSNMQKLAYYNQRAYEVPAQTIGVGPSSSRSSCHPGCRSNPYIHVYKEDVRPNTPPQKSAEAPVLLPIPFTFQAYNGSTNPSSYNNYYKGNPWAFYNFYKNNPTPYQSVAGQAQVPKTITRPEVREFQNEDLKTIDNIDDEKLVIPAKANDEVKPWQTDPLEQIVIDEIRANIAERAKLLKLPIKKRIKLERVAKVIKLDHLTRNKRHDSVASPIKRDRTENNEPYEAFLEKTTCLSSTEPGFFRVGNLSQPYPACCPQKIEG